MSLHRAMCRTRTRSTRGYASGEGEGSNVNEYVYRDAGGTPYLRVVRTSAKQFPQYHWEGGHWVKGKPTGPKLPYRLPELLAAATTEPIFICEGEKDVDNVAELGLVATCNPEGAGKWSADLGTWFAGKATVYILEDNDDAGRAHAIKVANALHGIVPEIRIVSFPELPSHGDVFGLDRAGRQQTQLVERAKMARTPPPPAEATCWYSPPTLSPERWIGFGGTYCAARSSC